MAFIPALIAAAGTLGAAGAGVYSNSQNLKAQQKQNEAQNALNAKSEALAEKMNQQGLATQVDANGNITYYDAGTNTWRTILAPQQAQINDASNAELLRSLSVDAPMARGEALRNSQAKVLDQGNADALRQQLGNKITGKGAQTGDEIASSLRLAREGAVNAGFDETQQGLTKLNLRTGIAPGGGGAASLAKARANAIAQTLGNPDLEGKQAASDMQATDLGNAINNYGTVANRAYATDGYNPPNPSITPTLNASLAASRNAAANGAGGAAQIINNVKIPAPIATPNYANLISSVAQAGNQLYSGFTSPSRSANPTYGSGLNGDWDFGG